MAKTDTISASYIMTCYMDFVTSQQNKPTSIDDFSQIHQFDADIFYKHFASFNALEKEIYNHFFEQTLVILKDSQDYQQFSKKEKLLSMYFTFFESLTLNKEFVRADLKGFENQLKALSVFSTLKRSFTAYIDDLELELFNVNVEAIHTIQQKTIKESAWIQLLFTLKFWLDDTSKDFEKTDVFIEKSITTSMELINTNSLHHIIDLAKFLYQEKAN